MVSAMTQRGPLEGSIVIETELFDHREVKPHFINPCCFGEDFAAWLKRELLCSAGLGMEFSEPIQEDYGWGLWATDGKNRIGLPYHTWVMDRRRHLRSGSSLSSMIRGSI